MDELKWSYKEIVELAKRIDDDLRTREAVCEPELRVLLKNVIEYSAQPGNKPLTSEQVKQLKQGDSILVVKHEIVETITEIGISFTDEDYWGLGDVEDGTIQIYAHKPEQEEKQ